MVTEEVQLVFRYGGSFEKNPDNKCVVYEVKKLKVVKYNGNGSLEKLKNHFENLTSCDPNKLTIMYHNTSLSSNFELIDASDDIDVSFMLGGESSSIVVYITSAIEPERRSIEFRIAEPIGDGSFARNSRRNAPLPDQHENVQVVPGPELVLECDMEDI
ncbi:hypothetical protein AMTR_s00060p00204200 [Amborella trichopoda]|uniref:PB1 domain-containing protein n=1 Tax=Amborella trichopoda TaxID=13333 RepID=W1NKA1_AMBTC|nr:hypothetical protein AMTR_s00060p00204200 [Amborella trichopoda]